MSQLAVDFFSHLLDVDQRLFEVYGRVLPRVLTSKTVGRLIESVHDNGERTICIFVGTPTIFVKWHRLFLKQTDFTSADLILTKLLSVDLGLTPEESNFLEGFYYAKLEENTKVVY